MIQASGLENTETKFSFYLNDEEQTIRLGHGLANTFIRRGKYPALLFTGPLGAGKTTMIRGIVMALPGGQDAEVSSPSFNILNIYPTKPEAFHFDLFRLDGIGLDPESEDVLMDGDKFILTEWSEFLPKGLCPENSIQVNLYIHGSGRIAELIIKDRSIKDMINSDEINLLKDYAI